MQIKFVIIFTRNVLQIGRGLFRPTKHSARISFPDHEEVNGIRFQPCHDKLCGVFIISFIIYNTVFSLSPQMMKRKDNS